MPGQHRPASRTPARRGAFSVGTALAGALGGAIVVGAVWGLTSAIQAAPAAAEASVNGTTITRVTLQKTLFDKYGRQVLETMIDNELVSDAATDQHVTASASAIQSAQAQIESAYGITTPAELTSFLQSNGLTDAQFQAILKNQVLEQELAANTVKVTDAEVEAYYKAHQASFTAKGAKAALPLDQVRSQIVGDIKQSKAPSAATLLASLAKRYRLAILDSQYKSLLTAIEGSSAKSGG